MSFKRKLTEWIFEIESWSLISPFIPLMIPELANAIIAVKLGLFSSKSTKDKTSAWVVETLKRPARINVRNVFFIFVFVNFKNC